MDFYTTGSDDGFEYIKVWDAGGTSHTQCSYVSLFGGDCESASTSKGCSTKSTYKPRKPNLAANNARICAMIILKKAVTSSCAATTFTSGPPFLTSYSYTIGDSALQISLPALFSEMTTDDDVNCNGGGATVEL